MGQGDVIMKCESKVLLNAAGTSFTGCLLLRWSDLQNNINDNAITFFDKKR